MKNGALILAAGASARLGTPKQLLQFEGKTLLRRIAETALQSNCRPVAVVLGANAPGCQKEVEDLPLEIVIANDWGEGASASLKSGLTRLLESEPNLSAVVILLCDQPFVTTATITNLVETFIKTKKTIVACQYNETIGVPALFAREMFDELFKLQGDAGARSLIKNKAASDLAITLAPEAAFDVDTMADYKLLLPQL